MKNESRTHTHTARAQNMRESFKNTLTHINTVYRNVLLFRFFFFVRGDVPFSGFTFDVTNFCNNLRSHTSPLPGSGGGSTLFPEYKRTPSESQSSTLCAPPEMVYVRYGTLFIKNKIYIYTSIGSRKNLYTSMLYMLHNFSFVY